MRQPIVAKMYWTSEWPMLLYWVAANWKLANYAHNVQCRHLSFYRETGVIKAQNQNQTGQSITMFWPMSFGRFQVKLKNTWMWRCRCILRSYNSNMLLNSSDAGDEIIQLWESITCLLMPCILKSSEHQQVWYCQYRIGNMQTCSSLNLIFFYWTKSKIWYEMWIHLWSSIKHFSMFRVN